MNLKRKVYDSCILPVNTYLQAGNNEPHKKHRTSRAMQAASYGKTNAGQFERSYEERRD